MFFIIEFILLRLLIEKIFVGLKYIFRSTRGATERLNKILDDSIRARNFANPAAVAEWKLLAMNIVTTQRPQDFYSKSLRGIRSISFVWTVFVMC